MISKKTFQKMFFCQKRWQPQRFFYSRRYVAIRLHAKAGAFPTAQHGRGDKKYLCASPLVNHDNLPLFLIRRQAPAPPPVMFKAAVFFVIALAALAVFTVSASMLLENPQLAVKVALIASGLVFGAACTGLVHAQRQHTRRRIHSMRDSALW